MSKKKIIVSACLYGGGPWRYDGKKKKLNHEFLIHWAKEGRLIPICPEVAGGLDVPRSPAEIRGEGVYNNLGEDVTPYFLRGAELALKLALEEGAPIAILKEGSPSCGSREIYDGSFTGKKIPGKGITARTLELAGIKVFNENELDQLAEYLRAEEEKE